MIGGLKHSSFNLGTTIYHVNKKGWSFFKRKSIPDAIFEVYKDATNIILQLEVDRIKKKWYNTIYDGEIKVKVEFQGEIQKEMLLSTLFYLHSYILTARRD